MVFIAKMIIFIIKKKFRVFGPVLAKTVLGPKYSIQSPNGLGTKDSIFGLLNKASVR